MRRPRMRIATLMLLVVIAALAVALVMEKRRSAKLLADAEKANAGRLGTINVEYVLFRPNVVEETQDASP